jgi:hypothetical protein
MICIIPRAQVRVQELFMWDQAPYLSMLRSPRREGESYRGPS